VQTKSLVFLLVPRVRGPGRLVATRTRPSGCLGLKAKFKSNVDKAASCFVPLRIGSVSEGVRSSAARLLGLQVRIPCGHGCLSLVNVVCRNLCDALITCPGKSYRLCLSLSVTRCNNKPIPLQAVGRRGQAKAKRKKCFRQMCFYPAFATDFIQNHIIHLIIFMNLPD
jgi:hypothetical protein